MARRDNSLKAWCQKNGHMELLQELANDINADHFYGDYTEFSLIEVYPPREDFPVNWERYVME